MEAEALITARIIRAVIHIPEVHQDPPDPRVLHTDHPDHLTGLLIRIIRADLIIPAVIPDQAAVTGAADADARGSSA